MHGKRRQRQSSRHTRAHLARVALLPALASFTAIAIAHAAPPTIDKGDTAWMLVATALVVLMIVPGLALFYGGLVRAKNILSVLMQVLVVAALAFVLWVAYGYSLAFDGGNAVIGSLGKLFLRGVGVDSAVDTFTAGVRIPELVYVAFQGAFAAISCALVVGAIAERAKFAAVLLFTALRFTLAYLPLAHMLWSGIAALLAFFVARAVFGLRVDHEAEREGLDISAHGESAYEI